MNLAKEREVYVYVVKYRIEASDHVRADSSCISLWVSVWMMDCGGMLSTTHNVLLEKTNYYGWIL